MSEAALRRGGRVVEGARLERVYTGNRIEGSNPSLSASCHSESVLRSRCGRIFPLFSRVMRVWLSTDVLARWPESGLSGPIFSGPDDCADLVNSLQASEKHRQCGYMAKHSDASGVRKKELGSNIQEARHSPAGLDQSAGRADIVAFTCGCRDVDFAELERVSFSQ